MGCVPGSPLQAIQLLWFVVNNLVPRSSVVQALIIGIQSPGALGRGFLMSWVSMRCCDPVKSQKMVEVCWTDVGMREKGVRGKATGHALLSWWDHSCGDNIFYDRGEACVYPASPPLTCHQLKSQVKSPCRGPTIYKKQPKVPGTHSYSRNFSKPSWTKHFNSSLEFLSKTLFNWNPMSSKLFGVTYLFFFKYLFVSGSSLVPRFQVLQLQTRCFDKKSQRNGPPYKGRLSMIRGAVAREIWYPVSYF